MLPVTPLRTGRLRPAPAAPLLPGHERAADHLRFIRDTIERAGSFTAVSGWGQALVGIAGLLAAALAGRLVDPALWLATWVGAAAVGAAIAAVAMRRKATRLGIPLFSSTARRFALAFLTPLVAGAILTVVFYAAGMIQRLPGVWLLLFGTAVVTGGAMSVSAVPVMGACFMALAVAAFVLPSAWGDLLMAAGFGGLNVIFGVFIAVKHGG
jgi:hypothetical protein